MANKLSPNGWAVRKSPLLGKMLGVMLLLWFPAITPAATPELIDQAIKKGIDYLISKQAEGNWETIQKRDPTTRPYTSEGGQWGGRTALITYALLSAGVSPQNPQLQQAIQFLRKSELVGTYAVALRAQVWNSLPKTPENKLSLQRDAALLLDLMKTTGPAKGFYTYLNTADTKTTYDHSSSQYGVLGAWACADNLDTFPPQYWPVVDAAWRTDQLADGSWGYSRLRPDATLSMTCAGLATLFVTQDFLNRSRPAATNGNPRDEQIAKSMEYVAAHFKDTFDDKRNRDYYYSLYGIERIGVASGYKYFNAVNWYDVGADFILSKQSRSGYFSGGEYTAPISTAYALLFLARGRAPLTMNKLQYDLAGKEANWNQRPRDLANLTRYMGKQTERDLNWQITSLKAPADELHDAPILYLTGNQELKFTAEEKAKLRIFAERGGLILAQADGASLKFAKSVRTLGSELFPNYEFRTLPQDHIIFTGEQFPISKWKKKPAVLGLSNGSRELMLLLPDDPARYWQPMDTRAHVEDFQLGANIFLYAVDKQNLLERGKTYLIAPDPAIKPTKIIHLARIQYDGNWNPEPGGWRRLAALMHNSQHVDLTTEIIKLGNGLLKKQKIAHLTGTTSFKLEQAQRDEIKEFLTAGGTLIIDGCGGKGEFAQSVETELQILLPDETKNISEPLPQESPIYHSAAGPIQTVGWRMFTKATLGDLKGGRLRGFKLNGRLAVVYSAEDLSTGLVGQPVDGINGYDPATASNLMTSILMFASKGKG